MIGHNVNTGTVSIISRGVNRGLQNTGSIGDAYKSVGVMGEKFNIGWIGSIEIDGWCGVIILSRITTLGRKQNHQRGAC